MKRKEIRIGVGDSVTTTKGFIDAWTRAEHGEDLKEEQRIDFEDLETLIKTLTAGRWVLLKKLHATGPTSILALANELRRNYKNVHTDVRKLESIGLIGRTKDDRVEVPWNAVLARLNLTTQHTAEHEPS